MSLRSDLLPLIHQLATSSTDSEVLSHYLTLEENLYKATLTEPEWQNLREQLAQVQLDRAVGGRFPPLIFVTNRRELYVGSELLLNMNRSATSFSLLTAIAVHGHEWDYETLFSHAWQEPYRLPSSLDKLQVAISRLRKKVAPQIVIESRPDGQGYILQGNPTVVLWERHRESVLEKVEAKTRDERLGRYLMQDLLGEGGFARVYRAELQGPMGFKKTVAIKVMRQIDPSRAQEIIHEGRMGGLLKHRNVVDTYELGVEDGLSFVAMEWVDGLSLKELIQTAVPPLPVALSIALDICRGLAYAHQLQGESGPLGLVHLDLKPGNILVGWDGSVKVADFGIAQLTGLATGDVTVTAGTPAYLSPEQAKRQTVDARSDVFTLGAVLYELVTGEVLYSGDANVLGEARVEHIVSQTSKRLAQLPEALAPLREVLAGCLTVELDERTSSVSEVYDALRQLQHAAGLGPDLDEWLAETLGDREQTWSGDLSSWHTSTAEDTVDLESFSIGLGGATLDEALQALKSNTSLLQALEALEDVESALDQENPSDRTAKEPVVVASLGPAGLERMRSGDLPYLVFELETGRVFSRGQTVVQNRPDSVVAKLLYHIAVHGAEWSRERLYTTVWERPYQSSRSDSALRMAVSRLRDRLSGTDVEIESLAGGEYAVKGDRAVLVWRGQPVLSSEQLDQSVVFLLQPKTNLPPEPNTFVGREAALEGLQQLAEEGHRLLTVIGPPGTGKTRFVKRFGALRVDDDDNVWFCNLVPARTGADVLSAVAATFEVQLTDPQEDPTALARRLGHAIANRGPLWVLLDNAEQVVESLTPWLRIWWEIAPEARFVVTSRVPLQLEMEQRYHLGPLPLPTSDDDEDNAAFSLFVSRAQAVKPGFTVTPANRGHIQAIVCELDGLPLAIELAAARCSVWRPEKIRARLSQRFKLLARPAAGSSAREATLQGALDWSWELLSPWEQSALAQCSVFAGGFDWEAVDEVVDLTAWPDVVWTSDVISALVEHSLCRVQEQPDGTTRLSLLVSVAAYAAKQLEAWSAEDVAELRQRHGTYYAAMGESDAIESLNLQGGGDRLGQLIVEKSNLEHAHTWAVSGQHAERAVTCIVALSRIIRRQGPLDALDQRVHQTLQLSLTDAQRAKACIEWGGLLHLRGETKEAMTPLQEALTLYETAQDVRGQGIALGRLGESSKELGLMEEADALYTRSLSCHQQSGYKSGEAAVLNLMGDRAFRTGETESAQTHYARSLKLYRALGESRGESRVLTSLALVQDKMAQVDLARQTYQQALRLSEAGGDKRQIAIIYGNMATSMIHRQFEKGLEYYERALELHREMGNRHLEGALLSNVATAYLNANRLDEAEVRYQRALSIHRENETKSWVGIVLGSMGTLYRKRGETEKALSHVEEAMEISQQTGHLFFEGMLHMELGTLHSMQGSYPEADGAWDRADEIMMQAQDVRARAVLYHRRSIVETDQKRWPEAQRSVDQALALAQSLGLGADSDMGEKLLKLAERIKNRV